MSSDNRYLHSQNKIIRKFVRKGIFVRPEHKYQKRKEKRNLAQPEHKYQKCRETTDTLKTRTKISEKS